MLTYQLVGKYYGVPFFRSESTVTNLRKVQMQMNPIDPSLPQKKRKLLEASLSLMIIKGYHATTVDEICAEAGVTKGSFFHYFKSKEELGKGAIDFFEKFQSSMICSAGLDRYDDPWTRLNKYLDFFIEMAKDPKSPRSCLISIMTQELSDMSHEFRALCNDKFLSNAKPLKSILDKLIKQYPSTVPVDSQQLSEYFLSVYQGSLILAQAKGSRDILVRNVEHFRRYVTSFFITED
jgi:TetR/AcrR family transcriptional regulator, transcriptional repressor for nem operon